MGSGSPPRGWAVGGGRAPNPRRRTRRQEAPPPGTLMPPTQRAKPARKSARCWFGDGPHARTPPHPQPVGSGPRQPAQRAGSQGWESARPRTPHTQAGGAPPRARSCRPHSAQSQLERMRAVGLVTGPYARTPPHPQPVGSGPRQPAQRAGSRGWESAGPRTPHTQAGGAPPPGGLVPPPQRAKPARKSARCGVGDGSHARTPPHPQSVGSGPRQPAQRAGKRGRESARPRTPHTRAGGAPPGRHPAAPIAPKASSKERAVGLVMGPHARTPPHPQPVGSGPRQPAQRAGSRGWESARPRTPDTKTRGAPPPGALVPPPQRAKPARKGASCGVGDGSPRPHPPAPTASG